MRTQTRMPPSASLFVDTAGWADPVLHNSTEHASMLAFYRRAIAAHRAMLTTNYVLAELVALLTARSRAPREQLLLLVNRIRRTRPAGSAADSALARERRLAV